MVYDKMKCDELIYDEKYSYGDVLLIARDYIHKGHELLTHPLSGSIKPNETPYKSVIISKDITTLNMNSLAVIEDSIAVYNKFQNNKITPIYIQSVNEDFQLIDFDIINN